MFIVVRTLRSDIPLLLSIRPHSLRDAANPLKIDQQSYVQPI